MTSVRVRLFAVLRELAGAPHVEAQGSTVGQVIDALCDRYGERFAAAARAGTVVVDGERASQATALAGGEEVALLPPVSGGATVGEPSELPAEPAVATIDFHVTAECNQECPYCWGPKGFERPVSTRVALRIVEHVKSLGARRIVFTGGDPAKRLDIGSLIRRAKEIGLEVALSTTGDELGQNLVDEIAPFVDLVSLPIDGSNEAVNARTKKSGHLASVLRALDLLRAHPRIDVKVCTPVTRHNLEDVPNILDLVDRYARTTRARVFYNVFQAFPRSMEAVDWGSLLVTDEEFEALGRELSRRPGVRVNLLGRETLDHLYVMVFPDGSLVVPGGPSYVSYGPFLEVRDLHEVIGRTDFDAAKHLRHSRGWERVETSR